MITATANLTGTITATAQLLSTQVGSCPNNAATVNSTPYATAPSGTTINVDVEDTAGADVGSLVGGKWRIGDSRISLNDSQFTPVEVIGYAKAEENFNVQVVDSADDPVGTVSAGVVGIADSTANLRDTGGTPISSTQIKAEATALITAPDAAISFNGVPYGNAKSGGSLNVVYNKPTVSVSVDDLTPSIGDVVTVEATPSNMVPTSYLFFAVCSANHVTFIAEQASNTVNWTVNSAVGSVRVFVLATDGTDEVYSEPVTITVSGLLLDNFPGAIGAFALKKIRAGYTGPLVELRRSTDNALKSFYPDANGNLSLTSEDGSGTSLGTWIGANSAFMKQLYDQGLSVASYFQLTNTRQPRVVNAGTLVTSANGLAAWEWVDSTDQMSLPDFAFKSNIDIYNIIETVDTSFLQYYDPATFSFVAQSGSAASPPYSDYGSPLLYVDGALIASPTRNDVYVAMTAAQNLNVHQGASTANWATFLHNGYPAGLWYAGKDQLIIAWEDASANRSAIEASIISTYSL